MKNPVQFSSILMKSEKSVMNWQDLTNKIVQYFCLFLTSFDYCIFFYLLIFSIGFQYFSSFLDQSRAQWAYHQIKII